MCDLDKGFKLCSCDEENLKVSEIGWKLTRVNPDKPLRPRKGRAARITYTDSETVLRKKIEMKLNGNNCFDFDFEPQESDRLSIKYKENKWFAYRWMDGQWRQDNSTSLSAWRTQLEPYKDGKVE